MTQYLAPVTQNSERQDENEGNTDTHPDLTLSLRHPHFSDWIVGSTSELKSRGNLYPICLRIPAINSSYYYFLVSGFSLV